MKFVFYLYSAAVYAPITLLRVIVLHQKIAGLIWLFYANQRRRQQLSPCCKSI